MVLKCYNYVSFENAGGSLVVYHANDSYYYISPVPSVSTEHYTYNFVGFFYNGVDILENWDIEITNDATIEVRFERIAKEYTVTFVSNNTAYGTVSLNSIVAEYGTAIRVSDTVVTINSQACIAYAKESALWFPRKKKKEVSL